MTILGGIATSLQAAAPGSRAPFLPLARERVKLGDLECGAKAVVWQQQETYFPAASQHLACYALGRIKLLWERPVAPQQMSSCDFGQGREAAKENELTASAGTVKSRLY